MNNLNKKLVIRSKKRVYKDADNPDDRDRVKQCKKCLKASCLWFKIFSINFMIYFCKLAYFYFLTVVMVIREVITIVLKLMEILGIFIISVVLVIIKPRLILRNTEYNRMMQKYKNMIIQFQTQDLKYDDQEFKSQFSNIIGNIVENQSRFQDIEWKRPEQFVAEKVTVFQGGKIQPTDILRGKMNNNYFQHALICMAEQDYRIKRLFECQNEDDSWSFGEILEKGVKYGCFFVNVFQKGIRKVIFIDDFFPVFNSRLSFSQNIMHNELWVAILEKVYAKIHGSYGQIEQGHSLEVMQDLTGAPTRTIELDFVDDEIVWNILIESVQKKYVLAVEDTRNQQSRGNLCSLVDAFETEFNSVKVKVIKLRNNSLINDVNDPNYSKLKNDYVEWKQLNPSLKYELEQYNTNVDGSIYWMEYKDILKIFNQIHICLFHTNYLHSDIQFQQSAKRGKLFSFNVPQTGFYYISVHQTSKRFQPVELQSQFVYHEITIVIAKMNGSKLQYICEIMTRDKQVWPKYLMENKLTKGKYVMFVKMRINQNQQEPICTLQCYGEKYVNFQVYNGLKNKQFLNQVYLDYIDRFCQQHIQQRQENILFCDHKSQDQIYAFLAAHNKGSKRYKLMIDVKIHNANRNFKKPYDKQQFVYNLGPNSKQIALIRFIRNYSGPLFSYQFKIQQ